MSPLQEAIAGAVRRIFSPLSRLLHRALDRFELPILSGLNRGRKWRVGSGVIACWLGIYENDEMAVFGGLIKPGDTVSDLGAHSGYFTLLAAKLAGPSGKVVAVEPHPLNLVALQRNFDINHVSNTTIVDRAIIDRHDSEVGLSADAVGFGYAGTVVASGGTFKVRTATLDGPPVPFGTPTTIDYPKYFWVVLAVPSGRQVPLVGNWAK